MNTKQEAVTNYANMFLRERIGADTTNENFRETFADCALPANPRLYPAIRREIERARKEESLSLLREWIHKGDPIFSVERTPTIYSYYRIASHDDKPWLQNISVHISRVTHYCLTEHRPSGSSFALRTHYANEPVHELASVLFGNYTALRHESV